MTNSCIITPDTLGPVKNGGIGTHSFYLAKFLSEIQKQTVTLLFTGPIENRSVEYWKTHYKEESNITFIHISELEDFFKGPIHGGRISLVNSLNIYRWLKDQNFKVCYFQEWRANGFASIQAKRTGLAFHSTILTCMMHSSSEWIDEGMQIFPKYGLDNLVTNFMERYCVEYADIVLSPSNYMLEWARNKGWKLPTHKEILPYLLYLPVHEGVRADPANIPDIIFFGRLETRKGLELFLQSMSLSHPIFQKKGKKINILFLGKTASSASGHSKKIIRETLNKHSDVYTYRIASDKGHDEALSLLIKYKKSLIVIPSLVDNFPYTVLECLELGLNVIAAKTGGIPEMFSNDRRLFKPNSRDLSNKILDFLSKGPEAVEKGFWLKKSELGWNRFCKNLDSEINQNFRPQSTKKRCKGLISVCIPYFNGGKYLDDLFKSLENQSYSNFEVVLIDDGSTESFSKEKFSEKKIIFSDRGWKFLSQANGGIGNARNFAVNHADGEYLVFVDADNIAEPRMLEMMLNGIETSGADCLTTHHRGFRDISDIPKEKYAYAYTPIGACKEAGIYENVFGDANFIIRKNVFLELGGFREDRSTSYEDWEFLALLTLSGFDLDVIPEHLVLYRHIEDSFSRSTNAYNNHMRAIRPYLEKIDTWEQKGLVASIGTMRHYATKQVDYIQPLTARELGLSPRLHQVLKAVYRSLSGGGHQNNNPNRMAKVLIRARTLLSQKKLERS